MRALPSPYVMPGLKEDAEVSFIIKTVLDVTGYTWEGILNKKRDRERVLARSLLFYFFRKKTLLTLKGIGDMFNKDHTTIINGVDLIENLLFSKDYLAVEWYTKIKNKL